MAIVKDVKDLVPIINVNPGVYYTKDYTYGICKRTFEKKGWALIKLGSFDIQWELKGYQWLLYPTLKEAHQALDVVVRDRPRPSKIRPVSRSHLESSCGQYKFHYEYDGSGWTVKCLMDWATQDPECFERYKASHGLDLAMPRLKDVVGRLEEAVKKDPPELMF